MTQDVTHQYNGLTELLPWLFVADDDAGVVCNKDSSLLAAWEFEGVDIESGHEHTMEMASLQFDKLLRNLYDSKPVIYIKMDRRKNPAYPKQEINNLVASYIDDIWKSQFDGDNTFKNTHTITAVLPIAGDAMSLGEITRNNIDSGMKLPIAAADAVKTRFAGGQKRFGFTSKKELDVILKRFEDGVCNTIENGNIGVSPRRLIGSELLGFLKSTASSGSRANVAVDKNAYLDQYLGDSFLDNRYSDFLILDGNKKRYVATFTLKSAPKPLGMQALRWLAALPVELSYTTVFRTVSKKEAESFLKSARTFDEMRSLELKKMLKRMMQRESITQDDDGARTEVGVNAMALLNEVKQGRAVFGWQSSVVTVYADSKEELEENCDMVVRTLEQSELMFFREKEGNLSGFCTQIPGQLKEPVRWHFVEAGNFTDLAPLITIPEGSEFHPHFREGTDSAPPNAMFKTRLSTPAYFNYHYGQLGHTLLIGPSRNGKTMLQMFLESQFLKYKNATIFNMDKDFSCKPQTYLMDGVHFDLNPEVGGLRANPVKMAKGAVGQAWLVGWVDRLFSYRGDPLSDKDIDTLSQAIKRIENIPDARLTTLAGQLPPELVERLKPWLSGGAWGRYFDNVEDNFSISKITTTEVGTPLANGMFDVVNAFTDYAFFRIERFLTNRELDQLGPTMVYFEEAGFLLDDPRFANKARDFLMTLAKKDAFLVMTAQSPEPFTTNIALKAAVRDNVATIIFMPNALATRPELGRQYKDAFGLNDNHLEIIANATSKQEYMVYRPQTGEFHVVEAKFPKEIVAALRSDAESQSVFNKIYNPEDEKWKETYLDTLLSLQASR